MLWYFGYCFLVSGEGRADFTWLSPGSPRDYSVLISSSELCDSISMQGTYNHVSLIRREWSLISGLEELKIYVKLITEQMSSQFGSSARRGKKRTWLLWKLQCLKMQTQGVCTRGERVMPWYPPHRRIKRNLNVRFLLNRHTPHYDISKQQLIAFINKRSRTFKRKLPS